MKLEDMVGAQRAYSESGIDSRLWKQKGLSKPVAKILKDDQWLSLPGDPVIDTFNAFNRPMTNFVGESEILALTSSLRVKNYSMFQK